MHQTTIGADPELLLQDIRTGSFYPACGHFGGSKQEPKKHGPVTYHEDNVALELGWEPSTSIGMALRHYNQAITTAQLLVEEHTPEYVALSQAPCALYHNLADIRGAQEFGCDPDFDAYREGAQVKRYAPRMFTTNDGDWRFAGGHIHIGYDMDVGVPPHIAAMLCDVYLTLPILSEDRQGMRRKFYGQPGRFRPKPYGLEYRTLSCNWFFNKDVASAVFENAFSLGTLLSNRYRVQELLVAVPWTTVKKAIRKEDCDAAAVVLSHLRSEVPRFVVKEVQS